MRIEVKGRNLPVSDDLREHVVKRFRKVARQVSELAELEVELFEERNPAIADSQVAEATLHLKGVTLRARNASRDMMHSINMVSERSRCRSSATATSAEAARVASARGPPRRARSAPSGAGDVSIGRREPAVAAGRRS